MTASERPRILAHGLDTLYLGIYCDLSPGLVGDLCELGEALKRSRPGQTAPYLLGSELVEVGWGGAAWQWRLVGHGWRLMIAERSPKDPAPVAMLQFEAEELWLRGARAAAERWLREVAPSIVRGGRAPERVIVSRMDMTVDFDGWIPSDDLLRCGADHRGRFVRRSRKAVATFRRDTRPLDEDEDYERVWQSLRFTGYSFGKGEIGARLYDKTEEIRAASGKHWFEAVWKRAPEEAAVPVWRLEFQLRRAALKQFGVDELEDLWPVLPELWLTLAGGLRVDARAHEAWERDCIAARFEGAPEPEPPTDKEAGWLTLRELDPREKRRDRWDIDPAWRALQDAAERFGHYPRAPLVRDRTKKADRHLAAHSLVRSLARLVGLYRLHLPPATEDAPDLRDAAQDWRCAVLWLLESRIIPAELEEHEWVWRELVGETIARLEAPATPGEDVD